MLDRQVQRDLGRPSGRAADVCGVVGAATTEPERNWDPGSSASLDLSRLVLGDGEC